MWPNLVFALLVLLVAGKHSQGHAQTERTPYIVYMGEVPSSLQSKKMMVDHHHSLLAAAIGDVKIARESKIRSYRRSFNAFAANLLPEEVKRLSGKEGVISVFPSTMRPLLTTRSWDFLGMTENIQNRNLKAQSNTIVAILDTGIYVGGPSFDDQGYGPPPKKWRGKCDKGANFTGCNNKVIGARVYDLQQGPEDTGEESTPADTDGHGTHTASTAGGRAVRDASLYGIAKGTARGGVPGARIAMYKVCGDMGCPDVSLLAGFDDALADGADVISVSIGGRARDFFDDVIAIGSFHAMKKGVPVTCAAGNEGPYEGTVQNVAPWIITVAATNVDRVFMTEARLGNGMKISGISVNTFRPKKKMYPLLSGDQAANASAMIGLNATTCDTGSLSRSKSKGKIILCFDWSGADYSVMKSGGVGTIQAMDDRKDTAFTSLIPATTVPSKIGSQVLKYINSNKNPQAVIYKTKTPKSIAPVIASFSSRGPQTVARNILKPDIAAPGLDILAGFTKLTPITTEAEDNRFSYFNVMSGTSMACPHVTAAAAYVKTFHPHWSPSAIKSALMTTAKPIEVDGIELPLKSGSGLLNPVGAVHPGLIYDMDFSSYLRYLCKQGYNGTTIAILLGGKSNFSCTDFPPARGVDGLNYPSMHLQLPIDDTNFSGVFHRVATHVGYGPATYKATVESVSAGLSVQVLPDTLLFDGKHQRRSFKVVVRGKISEGMPHTLAAMLKWSDSKHNVRSPIVIYKPTI